MPEREAVMEMLKLEGLLTSYSGGEGLIRTVTANSRIPVQSITREYAIYLLTGRLTLNG